MKKLQNSGYDEEFRKEVLRAGKNGFNKQVEADMKGEKPLYRPRGYQKMERYLKKKSSKREWFRKGGYDSFMMIPATPNSELKKMIQKRLKDLGLMETVRIIEKPGQKFIDNLKNNIKKKKKDICPEDNWKESKRW